MDINYDKEKQRIVISGDEYIRFVEEILDEYRIDYTKGWISKATGTIAKSEPIVDKYFNKCYVIDITEETNRLTTFAIYLIKGLIEGLSHIKIEEEKKDDKDK